MTSLNYGRSHNPHKSAYRSPVPLLSWNIHTSQDLTMRKDTFSLINLALLSQKDKCAQVAWFLTTL